VKGGEKLNFAELMTVDLVTGMNVPDLKASSRQPRQSTAMTAGFGRILDTTMARTKNRPVSTKADPVRRDASSGISREKCLQRPNRSVDLKTGRQAGTVTKTGNGTKVPDPDRGPVIEEKKLNESPDVLEALAQMTGMDRAMLKEILMALGIPEETLTSQDGFIEAAAILSEVLGLDAEQQDVLAELMKLFGDAGDMRHAAELAVGTEEDQSAESAQVIEPGNGTEASVTSQSGLRLISEFSDRLRTVILEKLDEYAAKQEPDTDALKEGARDAILSMLEKVSYGRSNASSGAGAGHEMDAVDPEAGIETQASDGDARSTETGKEARAAAEEPEMQETGGENDGENAVKPMAQQGTAQGNYDILQDAGMLAVQQNSYEQGASMQVSADRTVNHMVSAREIISQITGKAAVTLTQDRSEMVIELKPESLGKLSLKVITENGIVTAKFVAENTQVQKLLESNMQMLKESLERQGIIVQSLNVSVRQDGGQARENGPHNKGPVGIRQKGISPLPASRIFDTSGIAEAPEIKDPWLWQGSTINLTA
jgi:flagellar hook-length control protein FliK